MAVQKEKKAEELMSSDEDSSDEGQMQMTREGQARSQLSCLFASWQAGCLAVQKEEAEERAILKQERKQAKQAKHKLS